MINANFDLMVKLNNINWRTSNVKVEKNYYEKDFASMKATSHVYESQYSGLLKFTYLCDM